MNNARLRFYFKILIFTLLYFMSCGFGTSFWPNIISFLPSPQIWLIIIVFITIKWPPLFTIFYIYFLGYCLTAFSDVPLKMLWSSLLLVFSSIWFIKNRIRLSGAFSFITLTLFGSVVFEVSYYYFSDILETIPTTLMFSERLIQILLNFIFSYPLFFALDKVDTLIIDENDWARSSKQHHHEASHE